MHNRHAPRQHLRRSLFSRHTGLAAFMTLASAAQLIACVDTQLSEEDIVAALPVVESEALQADHPDHKKELPQFEFLDLRTATSKGKGASPDVWAPGLLGEAGQFGVLAGLSVDSAGSVRAVRVHNSEKKYEHTDMSNCRVVRTPTDAGAVDWDPTFLKYECSQSEYTAGIAQEAQKGGAKVIKGLLCCTPTVYGKPAIDQSSPNALGPGLEDAALNGTAVKPLGPPNWDAEGNVFDCCRKRKIQGVSVDSTTLQLHKILCTGAF